MWMKGGHIFVTFGNILLACGVALREQEHDTLDLEAGMSEVTQATLGEAVQSFLSPDSDQSVSQALHVVKAGMNLKEAATVVQNKKLPADVSAFVKTAASSSQQQQQAFSEESMNKARTVLNEMVEKAWTEMDDKIIMCKEFEERNRGFHEQVSSDITRLEEQISDLQRVQTEAMAGQATLTTNIEEVQGEQKKQKEDYDRIFGENSAEMVIRQNDLAVFQFILVSTKCEGATSLVQKGHRICATKGGGKVLQFDDPKMQKKYEHILSARSKHVISAVLDAVSASSDDHSAALLQSAPMNQTTPPPVKEEAPVQGDDGPAVEPETAMKTCPPTPPDCGLLHDKLSLLWGDYKDKVDELQMTMNKNEAEWTELNADFDAQIAALSASKARFGQQLAEAQSNMAADRKELGLKNEERGVLDHEYSTYMHACHKRIEYIFYQDMCALVVVRNSVLKTSEVCPGDKIIDCDLDDWVPSECSVSCDDHCPGDTPYKCGGWQTISRKVVVAPDDCGLKCPALERSKKCNQILCPIHCDMSEWSGFSKCTAECEGGVKLRTRNILMKPKNGGRSCDDVEDSQSCNTGSCDRDCSLAEWTDWTPCSMACGGGFQEKFAHVVIPIRGEGKCPKRDSKDRYAMQGCNEHDCVGDEICVATQDLLFALDSSGSLKESGFNIIKAFTVKLISKYLIEFWGQPRMQMGLIQFGNGIVMEDGVTISPAINAQILTDDVAALTAAVEGLPFKRGFTNMAQAFAMAETMFVAGSRKEAQQAIMVITDGKPSFAFQTNELVNQLEDKGVQRFFVIVNEEEGDHMKLMERWASQPWETNLIHVPGLEVLDADEDLWVQKAITMFCPMATSPSATKTEEKKLGFMMVKEAGVCGEQGAVLSETAEDEGHCAAIAEQAGFQSYYFGIWLRAGWCVAGQVEVDAAQWTAWQEDKIEPGCPLGDWTFARFYDFYAIEPPAAVEAP